ncbi:AbrB/MazE/SpoVT family DNA-binding domain-containing protein [Micromonospora sp. HNM0581]|uniref:AbrB/MazE/SpoVT family DNA-binding domain-containing protein n=1 Tax=Micromonospora sp. HNM0581 TaxID=2716341 RepID=UPI00146AAFF7|nr:AbrB/MazE/SpoVT family DNA-binding domain-containing protein [Micromonospora sp. HNM0581]NLU77820.1 AbrB/MazE/SpoVT family DNA-binding domain-containing protein [Micromonospora sp. HNM0581]
MARPDRSGRVTERGLMGALRWSSGHRIDIYPQRGMLVIASAPAGQHAVGSRGELPLPASVRQMCAILPGQPLLLAALVAHDLLVIHPASSVARLLADLHTQVIGGRRVG